MPVHGPALVSAGIVDDDAGVELEGHRHLETPKDHGVLLGDVLPIRRCPRVVSFGDLVIALGFVMVVAAVTRRPARQPASMSSASPDQDWGTAPNPEPCRRPTTRRTRTRPRPARST